MKKIVIILLSFAICLNVFAQDNWQCVYPNKKVYFESKDKYVHCIRVDSTSNDNRILYPFSDLHQIDWDCYSITSGSWLSKYILITEDGNTVFINGKNQQILIKNQAVLSESWEVFTNNDIKVKGEITSIAPKSFLGIEDSVKTIKFFVYDKNDIPINHTLNQLDIEVSKHFGLVKTVNFYYFEHKIDYFYHFDEFKIIGINGLEDGFRLVNLKEAYFDFQVGDEFHIYHAYTEGIQGPSWKNKTIHRYLSRQDYEDRIEYFYERKINTNNPKDTLHQIIFKGLLFNTEPNEPFGGDMISKVQIHNSPLAQMFIEDCDITAYFYDSDTCLRQINVDVCRTWATYIPGLGGPYYSCCEFWFSKYCYELVYYKKGNIEWGTPYSLSLSEYGKNTLCNIYPNPTTGEFKIESGEFIVENIEIFDVFGKRVEVSRASTPESSIDISHLSAGLYFVKVTTKVGVEVKKVLKE